MIRVNQTIFDCKKPEYRPSFASQPIQTQINEVPDILPSYNVKTPISYKKTGELSLPFDYKAHMYKLANGQNVVIVPKEGETIVKTYVSTGSMNEPDNLRGISHYIEHNLFNGSDGLEAGEFFGTVNKMGAYTNAATGFAETNYYISSNLLNDEDLEKKIKIHASMLESPRFATNMLEKEKGIVNSEINMILSNPENIVVNTTLKNLYNIKSTSQDLIGGTTDNITNLTREDVVNYYNNNYFPANMVTVITGEVKPDETIKLISKYFSANNKNPQARKFEKLEPIQKTMRKDIISDKATATHIMLGFNGPKNNDTKSQIHLKALFNFLDDSKTGRLNKQLKPFNTRAELFTEKISSCPHDNRAILLNAKTTEENSEKVLKAIFNRIHSIATNPPTDEELNIIKKAMLIGHSYIYESSNSINDIIGTSILDGNIDKLADYEKIVNSMTKEDLVNAAKEFLDLNKTAVTVLHPQSADKNSIESSYNQALSFTGNIKKQAINPQNITRYKLENNFDVLLNDTKNNNVFFTIEFNAEQQKDVKPAVIEVLNGILAEGSIYRDDFTFSEDLSKDGISIDFNSGKSQISAVANLSADDLEKSLKSAKEVIQTPRFTQETLDYVKSNIRASLNKLEKSANDKLYKELLNGHPKSCTKEDILNSLDSVTLDDVKDLYNHIISNAQGHITISAPFSKKNELQNVLFKEIGELPNVQPSKPFIRDIFKPVTETKILTDVHEKNQADIIEAFKYRASGNLKDEVTVDLLNIILGGNASSRLFNDLREKQQLAYRVNSRSKCFENAGVFKLYIGTTTENKETGEVSYDNVQKAINGFNKHIENIKSEKVSEEELETAKLNLKNMILSSIETNAGKTDSLSAGIISLYGPLIDNKILEMIDQITVDDIYNAANYIFSNKPTYSILATENTLKTNKEFFKTL